MTQDTISPNAAPVKAVAQSKEALAVALTRKAFNPLNVTRAELQRDQLLICACVGATQGWEEVRDNFQQAANHLSGLIKAVQR